MFYPVMLLKEMKAPFDCEDYWFEPKYNGIRLELANFGGETSLYTRHQTEVTNKFPEITCSLNNIILDGELIALGAEGLDEFELVMKRFALSNPYRIQAEQFITPVTYVVFDILHYHKDLRDKPLSYRKEVLKSLEIRNPNIQRTFIVEGSGIALFKAIQEKGMEGIVAKKKQSKYQGKRTGDWLKIINWTFVEGEIIGFRKNKFALLCKYNQVSSLVELVSYPLRRLFYNQKIDIHDDPMITYVKPIKCTLKGRGFKKSNHLRTPILLNIHNKS